MPASSFKTYSVKQQREVVIDGVAFRSSGRSLVRKDGVCIGPMKLWINWLILINSAPKANTTRHEEPKIRAKPYQRPYRPKPSNRHARGFNMTLTNGRKPNRYVRRLIVISKAEHSSQSRKVKSMKYIDKQCSRFSVSGLCLVN